MKLKSLLFGQVIRTAKISGPSGGSLYGVNLVKACEARYGFLQGPRLLNDFDPTKGITFLHGYFERRIVIDRFQVYNNGLLAEAKADTDDCEQFLNDVMKWVTQEAGLTFDESESRNFYTSHVEAEMDISLPEAFPKFSEFGQQIANAVRSYGHVIPDLAVYSFALASEPSTTFKIERREGTGSDSRTFFCTSPLRTSDQIKLLEVAEKLFHS